MAFDCEMFMLNSSRYAPARATPSRLQGDTAWPMERNMTLVQQLRHGRISPATNEEKLVLVLRLKHKYQPSAAKGLFRAPSLAESRRHMQPSVSRLLVGPEPENLEGQ